MRIPIAVLVVLWTAISAQNLVAQAQSGLTEERVSQRLEALQATGTPNQELLSAYDAVRQRLNQAASFERDTANYLQALTNAPERSAEAQRRLDELEAMPPTAVSPGSLSQASVDAELASARFELTQASDRLGAIERQLATREANAGIVRTRLVAVIERLEALPEADLVVDPDAPPSLAEATQWLVAAESAALRAEQGAQEARLASQPARYGVLQIERAEASARVERLAASVRELESAAADLRSQTAEVPLNVEPDSLVYALAIDLRGQEQEFLVEVEDIRARLNALRSTISEIDASTRALGDRFATARRVVEFAGDSESLGSALVSYWREIDSYRYPPADSELSRDIGDAVISRIRHEETLAALVSAAGFVSQTLADMDIEIDRVAPTDMSTLMDLARANRTRLAELITVESDQIEVLQTLDAAHENLAALIAEYEVFLGGLIIWVPSHAPLWQSNVKAFFREFDSLKDQVAVLRPAEPEPALFGLALVALLLLLGRRRLRQYQHDLSARIARPSEDSVRYTFLATLTLLIRALPAALLIMIIGDLFEHSVPAAAISAAMVALASVLYVLLLLRMACEDSGLGIVHFGWQTSTCERFALTIRWLLTWWLPVATIATLVLSLQADLNDAVIGRTLFLLATILLATPIIRALLRPPGLETGWRLSTVQRRSGLAVLAVLTLVAAELILGHLYSLDIVDNALLETLWVGTGLLFLHAVLMRSLRVARRRARLAELMAAREQKQAGEETPVEEAKADLGDLSAEIGQLLNVVTIAAITGSLLYIWSPLLPAFETLKNIELWTTTSLASGEPSAVRITLATLLIAILLVAATIFAAGRLPALVELLLRSRTTISAGARYTIKTLLSYTIVGAGTSHSAWHPRLEMVPAAVADCRARGWHRLWIAGDCRQLHKRIDHSF